jgi:3-phenylpropionate/trans-cinnamate dioxygenase ferredoxin subunit
MVSMDPAIRSVRRVPVARVDDLAEGTMLMVQVDGTNILLVNQDGLHALQGTCTHEYFELDKGFLTAGSVTCALHLSRFDLTDGEPLDPPAELPLVVFAVDVEGDRIILELPEGEIRINE